MNTFKRNIFIATFAVVVAALFSARRLNCRTTVAENGHYAITNVAVADVKKGILLPDRTVEVQGDRIVRISPGKKEASGKVTVIDGTNLFLIPGLVDSHVHFLDPETFGPLCIAHGVVLVRDMGNTTSEALSVRKKLDSGEILGPEMVTAGNILDGFPPFVPPISTGIESPAQGRQAVRELAAAGVDQIKVYSGLERTAYLAIVDEAKRHGLKPVGHVPETVGIQEAASVGQKSCEHMFGFGKIIATLMGEPMKLESGGMGTDVDYFIRQDEIDQNQLRQVLGRIRDYGMVVCPTLVVFKHGAHLNEILEGQFPMKEFVSPLVREIWKMWETSQPDPEHLRSIQSAMKRFLFKLHKLDFTLLTGTDLLFPGIVAGYSLHEEMEIWQEAGIPPSDILKSTTIKPAEFVGLGDRLGSIEENKTASFILVRANPFDDVRNLEKIESVFLRGRYFSRKELDHLLQEVTDNCFRIPIKEGLKSILK